MQFNNENPNIEFHVAKDGLSISTCIIFKWDETRFNIFIHHCQVVT